MQPSVHRYSKQNAYPKSNSETAHAGRRSQSILQTKVNVCVHPALSMQDTICLQSSEAKQDTQAEGVRASCKQSSTMCWINLCLQPALSMQDTFCLESSEAKQDTQAGRSLRILRTKLSAEWNRTHTVQPALLTQDANCLREVSIETELTPCSQQPGQEQPCKQIQTWTNQNTPCSQQPGQEQPCKQIQTWNETNPHRAASSQGRSNLARDHGKRKIPWSDGPYHPHLRM